MFIYLYIIEVNDDTLVDIAPTQNVRRTCNFSLTSILLIIY